MTEKNIPNIMKVQITKDHVREEWVKTMPVLNRKEIKLRKESFVMEKWLEAHPDIDYINYATIEELANRTEYIGAWMRRLNAEFNAMITLPEWAAKSLNTQEVEKLKDKFKQVNKINREVADRKMALAKHYSDMSAKVDEQYESDLGKLLKDNEKLFILTYPKNQLPLHYVLSNIQFTARDRSMSEIEKASLKDNYVSPSDYENNLLDSFRKDLWDRHLLSEDIKKYLESQGVNFYIPSTSVGAGHLTPISHLLVY